MAGKRDSEAPAKDAQEEPSVPVGEESAKAESFDPADRIPGEVTTPFREMELDARAKLSEGSDPEQVYHRPYIEGDPAKYRRSGQAPDWALAEDVKASEEAAPE